MNNTQSSSISANLPKGDAPSLPKGDAPSLPRGWEIKKLGEVSEYFNGLTYSPKDVSDKGTIVLRSSNIQNDELDFSNLVRVNVNIKEKLFLKEGDILMCSRNGSQRLVGKTAPILNLHEPMTFGTFMMIIRSEFSPYLLWFFKTDEFKKQINGGENTMINQVTRYMLDEIKIPLPPLPEQQRIVAILDACFSAIEQSRKNAEQNLKNAKELFESYLQGVFGSTGSPTKREGWEERVLKEVCELKSGITISPSLERTEGDVLYTKVGDMNLPGNEVEINTSRRFVNSKEIKLNQIIPKGAIIFPKRGGAIATNKKRKIIKPTIVDLNTMAVLPSKKIDNDYFFYWFQLFDLSSISNGANIPQINNYSFDEVYFPYPICLKAQQTIVLQLDALRAETQKLETTYQNKLDDLEELKKSILQKAFAGELKTEKEVAV